MRKIFLDDLPRWGKKIKQNNGKLRSINWAKCVSTYVNFIYDDIEGKVEIVDYNKSHLYVKYNDSDIYKIHSGAFTKCQLGILLNKKTKKFRVEIGVIFKDNKRNIIITNKEYRDNPYNKGNKLKWYKYKCNKCGWYEGWIEESPLLNGGGCSCCASHTIVEGINNIPTVAPWMVKFFQGGYDEAKLYSHGSMHIIYPICPDCNKVKNKSMKISSIYANHSIGCNCGDGISYPNKIVFHLLSQLNSEFISEASFNWTTKRYDFYLHLFNSIVEVHGLQHYKEKQRSKTSRNLKEEQENDKYKEELAKENGIDNYIIIDARYSELEFIKSSILNSKLNELYDLSKIQWIKCEEFALSNLTKIACELECNNFSTTKIADVMKVGVSTVITYLKRGTKIGWCNYNPKKEMINAVTNNGKMNGKPVEIFKNNISLGIFENCHELDRQSENVFGIKLNYGSISSVCRGETNNYKGFIFNYVI